MPAYSGTTRAISSRNAWLRPRSAAAARGGAVHDVGEQAPLAAGLAHPAGQLGAEHDAALGGGLGAAALLLVAGGDGQQHDVVALDQHLAREHHVLVDAQGHQPGRPRPPAGRAARRGSSLPDIHSTSRPPPPAASPSAGRSAPAGRAPGSPSPAPGPRRARDRRAPRAAPWRRAPSRRRPARPMPTDGHEAHPVAPTPPGPGPG